MAYANQVIVVPGYGLAVAQAQHAVKELADLLEEKGVEVKIRHPPGCRSYARSHECAFAEADVVSTTPEGNGRRQRRVPTYRCDIGDRRQRRHSPGGTRTDPSSPIYGMPILNVDQSRSVIVLQAVDVVGLCRYREPTVLR